MSKYRKFALRGMFAGAFIALFAMFGGFITNNKPLVAQSNRDCDSNAIINCGAMDVPELLKDYRDNATGDLPQIYNAFGINVSTLNNSTPIGQVHKDGTVWLNGKQIGSGAITAGRHYKAGSTSVAGVWARSPSVSFAASSIDAFIGFENGKPAWAILSACGNPVKWSKPNTTLSKTVSTPDLASWVEDATYVNTSEVRYLLKVGNNGNATDTNVSVIDYLPSYQTYVPGSTKINGVATSVDDVTKNGLNLGAIAPGKNVQVTFRAKIQVPATKCGVTDMVNKARIDSDKSGPKEDTATTHTNVTCVSISCNALNGPDSIMAGQSATFTASATATGTTINSYEFNVDGKVVQNTKSNSLLLTTPSEGTHKINVTVHFANGKSLGGSGSCAKALTVVPREKPPVKTVKCDSLTGPITLNVGDTANYIAIPSDNTLVSGFSFTVNGNPVTATGNKLTYTFATAGTYTIAGKVIPKAGVTDGGSANCVKTVTVKEVPKPIYSCDTLTITPSSLKVGGTVTANGAYTAKNGATFKSATFNFGEGAPVVVTNANAVTAQHTYTTAGTKNITLSVEFTVAGQVVTSSPDSCKKNVSVTNEYNVVTSCDALDASKSAIKLGESVTLTAQTTATGTTITKYEFMVNQNSVQTGLKDNYVFTPTAAGSYDIVVYVTFANGDVRGGKDCAAKVTVTEVKTPVYTCDLLTLSKTTIKDGDKVTATVKYTATNGAVFKNAVVNFGEANVNVANATNGSFTADYTYKTAKEYAVTATVAFTVNGAEVTSTNAKCASKVSTTPPVIEKCPIPGKEQYDKNDTVNCNDVKGVTTLPDTGAGDMIGLFAAVTAAGAFLHNVWMRKFNQ